MHSWSLIKLYLAFLALTLFMELVRFQTRRRKPRRTRGATVG